MSDLVTWLRAQLDDDEQVAREADGFYDDRDLSAELVECGFDREVGDQAARWDPARVLAEVDAKRRLLDWLEAQDEWAASSNLWTWDSDPALRLLALPYADRDGYREEWRP